MTQQPSLLPDLPPTDHDAADHELWSDRAAHLRRLTEALAEDTELLMYCDNATLRLGAT